MSEINIFPREAIERIIDNTRKADKQDGSDNLFVGYDKAEKDKTVLAVFRKSEDKIYVIKMFEDEEANMVYNLLTGGM